MMKKLRFIMNILLASVAFIACSENADLSPTGKEFDLRDSMDLNYPLVKKMYEDYGVAIVWKFDTARDIEYNIISKIKYLKTEKLTEKEEIDSALTFYQESVLNYFSNEGFIKKYFPRNLIWAKRIHFYNDDVGGTAANYLVFREGEYEAAAGLTKFQGDIHSYWNAHTFLYSMKVGTIYYKENGKYLNYDKYKIDNLFLLWAWMLENHPELSDELGRDFFWSNLDEYYGLKLISNNLSISKGLWDLDGGVNDTDKRTPRTATLEWYFSYGFLPVKNYFTVENWGVPGSILLRSSAGDSGYCRTPASAAQDLRCFINYALVVNDEKFACFSNEVKERMRVLVDRFDRWGFDIRTINPTIAKNFPRN